jgi:hypothetical protein
MVNQKATDAPLLRALFDARLLHVVRRGYSAQDEPGERYDAYVIDYGGLRRPDPHQVRAARGALVLR